jgi:hypothetical protein
MQCPMCGGELIYMGELGELSHYQCRNCGHAYHTSVMPESTYDDDIENRILDFDRQNLE